MRIMIGAFWGLSNFTRQGIGLEYHNREDYNNTNGYFLTVYLIKEFRFEWKVRKHD